MQDSRHQVLSGSQNAIAAILARVIRVSAASTRQQLLALPCQLSPFGLREPFSSRQALTHRRWVNCCSSCQGRTACGTPSSVLNAPGQDHALNAVVVSLRKPLILLVPRFRILRCMRFPKPLLGILNIVLSLVDFESKVGNFGNYDALT